MTQLTKAQGTISWWKTHYRDLLHTPRNQQVVISKYYSSVFLNSVLQVKSFAGRWPGSFLLSHNERATQQRVQEQAQSLRVGDDLSKAYFIIIVENVALEEQTQCWKIDWTLNRKDLRCDPHSYRVSFVTPVGDGAPTARVQYFRR